MWALYFTCLCRPHYEAWCCWRWCWLFVETGCQQTDLNVHLFMFKHLNTALNSLPTIQSKGNRMFFSSLSIYTPMSNLSFFVSLPFFFRVTHSSSFCLPCYPPNDSFSSYQTNLASFVSPPFLTWLSLPPYPSQCTCFPPALCSLSKRHFSPPLLLRSYSPPR